MSRGQLPKAYLRLDPNIDQVHPDWPGFVQLLLIGNRQPRRGIFKELTIPENIIGKDRVAALVARGDLIQQPDGSWVLGGWDIWQEGDLEVGERMRRMRAARNVSRDSPSLVTDELRESDGASVTKPSPPSEASRRIDVLPNSIKTRAETAGETPLICPEPRGAEAADPINLEIAALLRWVQEQTGLDPSVICKRVTLWNGRWLVNPYEGSLKRRLHTLEDLREWRTRLLAEDRAKAQQTAQAGERTRTSAQLDEFRRGLAGFKAAVNGGNGGTDRRGGEPAGLPNLEAGKAESDPGAGPGGRPDPVADPLPVAVGGGTPRPP